MLNNVITNRLFINAILEKFLILAKLNLNFVHKNLDLFIKYDFYYHFNKMSVLKILDDNYLLQPNTNIEINI